MATSFEPTRPPPHVGDALHRIFDDLKTIAKDEAELARIDIARSAKIAAADASALLLSAVVALIGLGFAAAAAVDALSPLIPPLWGRLLVMGAIYLVVGGIIARSFAGRLSRDVLPDLQEPIHEAKKTAREIERGLQH